MSSNKPNNYAFIDSQNLNLAVKKLGWDLDFEKFRIYLKDKYGVEKAFLFLGYIKENEKLYTKLQKAGYIVVFKPTLQIRGATKGNCDAELVLHCMIEIDNFDKALIISNDGDFYCLIEYLIANKKLLKIITPSFKYSSLLKEFASYIVEVPLFKDKVIKIK
jgi:uncharacterized LabA/DUF88 family protein